jgi:hypothetical protein
MKNTLIALVVSGALCGAFSPAQAAEPIHAMILDGEQGGPYHAWQQTTPYLKRMLEDTKLFQVDVVTAPPANGDFSAFKPDWKKYKVVVLNYDAPDERWSADLKTSFENYVKNGGNVVAFHAANNAFPNWTAWNQMMGIGGWRNRSEKSGPLWYLKDGKIAADETPGRSGSHGQRLPYAVNTLVKDHPITKGLPAKWMHAADELYATLRGPGQNMTVLATAFSDPANKGTGREEPVLMVLTYGKGRIFHTVFGHDVTAMNCVGFVTTYQRGAEWAATGKVTQKIPADFPTADKVSTAYRGAAF